MKFGKFNKPKKEEAMKQILFIIFSLFVITLFSQFNEPLQVNFPNTNVQFSGQQACKIAGNNIYLSFVREEFDNGRFGYIYFAFSENNGQDFTITEVDTMWTGNNPIERFSPVPEVLANGRIIIFYPRCTQDFNSSLYTAISDDNGQTFITEIIADSVYATPQITINNDVLELSYFTGMNEQLSNYNYFSHTEQSENEDGGFYPLAFWGSDELFGPVHSNDDIWIHNLGGWPTFHEMVTTSAWIMDRATMQRAIYSAPMDEIFLGGWAEEIPEKLFDSEATLNQENGLQPFDPDKEIVYVKINGNSFQSMYGDIEFVSIDTFGVYSWFPANSEQANEIINAGGNWYEDSEHIWTNYIPIYDTLWTEGPSGTIQNQSVWIESELWIEGVVEGKQTWGCADTVFVVGDITYQNTPVGEAPDNEDNPNLTDYFSLISEKKIIIKYKHKDPFNDMMIRDDNCNNIYLYGAYAAIGEGDVEQHGVMACHYDGIFTWEYQHPHGSTPDFNAMSPYTGNDTLYTYIDFHKFIFPPDAIIPPEIYGFNLNGGYPVDQYDMCGYPYESDQYLNSFPNNGPDYVYPYGTDYPWYNPVWPESGEDIFTERGAIYLYGSLSQRRRGFIHRSGADPYNHLEQSEWDLENFHYDGYHSPTGYNKEYHYDNRLLETTLIDFPSCELLGIEQNIVIANSIDNGETFNVQLTQNDDYPIRNNSFDTNENIVICAYQVFPSELIILTSDDHGETFEEYNFAFYDHSENILLKNIKLRNSDIYLLAEDNEQDLIIKLNVYENYYEVLESYYSEFHLSDFNISNSGEKVYVNTILNDVQNYIEFCYTNGNDNFTEYFLWIPDFIEEDVNSFNSKIAINFDESDSVYAAFLKVDWYNDFGGDIFLTSGRLDSLTTKLEEEFDLPEFFISNYPNPFNPEVNISFSLPERDFVKLSIYNLKGQLVRTLINEEYENGNFNIKWNGMNKQNEPVGSGVYFYKFESEKFCKIKKMLMIR